jgi:hypothetical protein
VVSTTDLYGRIPGFLNRNSMGLNYVFITIIIHLIIFGVTGLIKMFFVNDKSCLVLSFVCVYVSALFSDGLCLLHNGHFGR